jgi:hypothetical protein
MAAGRRRVEADMEPPRWKIITPSHYEWERRGLDHIRTGLPDHDPYRAWANFEFQTDDGAIYEVDLLVLTKQGFWLVECKAWGGCIRGDTGAWTRSQDGKIRSEDNQRLPKAPGRLSMEASGRRLTGCRGWRGAPGCFGRATGGCLGSCRCLCPAGRARSSAATVPQPRRE